MNEVTYLEPRPNHRLFLRFDDGLEGEVDISRVVPFRGVFAPLDQPKEFGKAFLHPEGRSAAWPWGADICPDVLHAHVAESVAPKGRIEIGFPGWLLVDEFEEACVAFENALNEIRHVKQTPARWKWVAVSAHDGLQGLMALALAGSEYLIELTSKYQSERRAVEAPIPDHFLQLYAALKTSDVERYTGSRRYAPSKETNTAVLALAGLRNRLLLSLPSGWVLRFAELPDTLLPALEVAIFLTEESRNILWPTDEIKERMLSAIDGLKEELIARKQEYQLDEQEHAITIEQSA